jgi:hypothetical protein
MFLLHQTVTRFANCLKFRTDNSTPVLKRRCDAAQSTYSACQAFLDQLPDDATLEVG